MKITIYQPQRKNKKGEMSILFVFTEAYSRTTVDSGVKSILPLIKSNGMGIGIIFDKKEPNGRAKQKRLEQMFWKLDEKRMNTPHIKVKEMKDFFESEFLGKKSEGELVRAMETYISESTIRESTKDILKRTLEKIKEFDPTAGFEIDESWLDNFVSFLESQGTKTNGIGIHLRNVRTVFNWARRKKLTTLYPFLDYRIKVEKTAISNMSLQQIKEFKDYPCEPYQVEYRDMFMLIFYLAGVNIGDLLTCKKLTNGRLVYVRKKTGHPLSIPVYPEAIEIIERYKGKNFLLNMGDRYKDYHGYMHKMNDGLKKIGKVRIVPDKVGKLRKKEIEPFFEGISTYVARYTFASIAAECGIGRDVIAACLGHSWSDVTSHYIAYSQKQIDDAIRKVIDYVKK